MRTLLIIAGICLSLQVFSQQEQFETYLDLITDLSERNETDEEVNEFSEQLFELWQHPLNINKAQNYDFAKLFWLNETQLTNLESYVSAHKPIVSLFELTYLTGFDTTLIRSLSPFLVCGTDPNAGKSGYWDQSLILRSGRVLEKQKGYATGNLEGDPWKHYVRYRIDKDDQISAGFTLEKDAGEALFKGSNRAGPDYYSGFVQVRNTGILKNLCIGDYATGYGQGLVLGPGFSLGKSSQAINVVQRETGIRPYTSGNENRYLRGLAAEVQWKNLKTALFFSIRKMDANITLYDSVENRVIEVSSLQNTGIHATEGEIADEKALKETTAGFHIAYDHPLVKLGISGIHSQFDANLVPTLTNYNQFYLKGNTCNTLGADYKLRLRNMIIFGETAIDQGRNLATLNGVYSSLSSKIQLSILHRYYSRSYNSLYGNAFGEGSRVQNEEGVFSGISYSPLKRIKFSAYMDYFRFPWLKDGMDAPSYGKEFLVRADYAVNRRFNVYLQYRFKQKMQNAQSSDSTFNSLTTIESNRFRAFFRYSPTDQLDLTTLLEVGHLTHEKSYLLCQDIHVSSASLPVSFYLRYAVFETGSYNSRIYAYENDLLFTFNVNSYYYQGQRYFVMLKYSPLRRVDVWLRYSQTLYPGRRTVSSGDYGIDGNTKSDIRMQLFWRF